MSAAPAPGECCKRAIPWHLRANWSRHAATTLSVLSLTSAGAKAAEIDRIAAGLYSADKVPSYEVWVCNTSGTQEVLHHSVIVVSRLSATSDTPCVTALCIIALDAVLFYF